MTNLTSWFPGDVKPVHVWAYEFSSKGIYSYWNGSWWGHPARSPQEAYSRRFVHSVLYTRPWRGLTEPA